MLESLLAQPWQLIACQRAIIILRNLRLTHICTSATRSSHGVQMGSLSQSTTDQSEVCWNYNLITLHSFFINKIVTSFLAFFAHAHFLFRQLGAVLFWYFMTYGAQVKTCFRK